MLIRNCAGGVVFFGDRVFLLQNDKGEWVFPKGVIRPGEKTYEVALKRVKVETGLTADIFTTAGQTYYEFFSNTRRMPVSNRITWYVMTTQSEQYEIDKSQGFLGGEWFSIKDASETITYSQDRSLLHIAYDKLLNTK